MFEPCFVMNYLVPFQVFNHLDGEERAGCFTLLRCSVVFPHAAMPLVSLQCVIVLFIYLFINL